MRLWELPPMDVRPHLRVERAALLELLEGLTPDQWSAPTACPGWSVKDVALHLVDDDLGWLSRGRDQDPSGLLSGFSDHREFVAALHAKNDGWVKSTRVLSSRVIRELLAFAGTLMDEYWDQTRLDAPTGRVDWMGPDPVPVWLGIGRDFTEHRVHGQQIREAVGAPGLNDDYYLGTVLRIFIWGLPYHYRSMTGPDVDLAVEFTGEAGGVWTLQRRKGVWGLVEGRAPGASSMVRMPSTTAWRLFTGALNDQQFEFVEETGDLGLTRHLLAARSIII
ncbi:maleylpyruvate isomerase N-terminal domain-containing protein [Streptosporangium sp. NPDC001681]|uniref:maleylpyruvate isomerase N-terminal domain-containing protein n=1 Tax=Streptosporangium sp. NPDC001681 TaxID=3154395 RepID=UPI00331EA7CD